MSKNSIKIRPLELNDLGAFVLLCKSQVDETLPHMPFEADVVAHYAKYAIRDDQMSVFVAEQDGKLIGYLVANLEPYLFCHGYSASQEVVYVLPEYRTTRAAYLLLKYYVDWAAEHEVLETYVGVANGIDMERKKAFFERKGFDVVGYYLRKT